MTSAAGMRFMIKREFTQLKDAASGLPVKKYHLADWRKTEA